MLDLVPSDDGLLLEHLDGIALAGQLVSRQVHLGEEEERERVGRGRDGREGGMRKADYHNM